MTPVELRLESEYDAVAPTRRLIPALRFHLPVAVYRKIESMHHAIYTQGSIGWALGCRWKQRIGLISLQRE